VGFLPQHKDFLLIYFQYVIFLSKGKHVGGDFLGMWVELSDAPDSDQIVRVTTE